MRQVLIVLGLALLLATPAMAQAPADTPPQTHRPDPHRRRHRHRLTPRQAPAAAQDRYRQRLRGPAQPPRSRLDVSVGYTYVNYDQQDEPTAEHERLQPGSGHQCAEWLQLGAMLTWDYSRESSPDVGLNGTKTSLITFMTWAAHLFSRHHHSSEIVLLRRLGRTRRHRR